MCVVESESLVSTEQAKMLQCFSLTVVHMQQMFDTDNHYIQDEGCGHIIVPFGL